MSSTIDDLINLARELEKTGMDLERNAYTDNRSGLSAWTMVWLLMIGTSYSLAKAEPFISVPRDPSTQLRQARTVLQEIVSNRALFIEEEKNSSWVVGYYLNSSEQRIQSSLHRLLKAFCNTKGRVYINRCIESILYECPYCKTNPNSCYPKTVGILDMCKEEMRKLNDDSYVLDYFDTKPGIRLCVCGTEPTK